MPLTGNHHTLSSKPMSKPHLQDPHPNSMHRSFRMRQICISSCSQIENQRAGRKSTCMNEQKVQISVRRRKIISFADVMICPSLTPGVVVLRCIVSIFWNAQTSWWNNPCWLVQSDKQKSNDIRRFSRLQCIEFWRCRKQQKEYMVCRRIGAVLIPTVCRCCFRVALYSIYKMVHLFFFLWVACGRGLSTALIASSKTLFKLRWVRAEHSKYLWALISFATMSAWS